MIDHQREQHHKNYWFFRAGLDWMDGRTYALCFDGYLSQQSLFTTYFAPHRVLY